MERQAPSIFNDIVGPTMVGPSSSHTCGPSRIGFLAQQLLPGKLKKATVAFAREGAYTLMYKGQRSDMGYVNGLLGRRPEDIRLRRAFAEAKEAGVDVEFVIEDFTALPPNISHITMTNTEGQVTVVHSDSTGGGTVKLLQIDGFEVGIVGDCYELIVYTDCGEAGSKALIEKIQAMDAGKEGATCSTVEGRSLINITCPTPTPIDASTANNM